MRRPEFDAGRPGGEEARRLRRDLLGRAGEGESVEQVVRQMIQAGIPKRMPSFQYNFTPGEVDDLIAYLKIR